MNALNNTAHAAVKAAACLQQPASLYGGGNPSSPKKLSKPLTAAKKKQSGAQGMQASAAIQDKEFVRNILFELTDQAQALYTSHQAVFALAQLVEGAGNTNAVPAPHLAALMQMVGEAMASRTAGLEACIAQQRQVLSASAAQGGAA